MLNISIAIVFFTGMHLPMPPLVHRHPSLTRKRLSLATQLAVAAGTPAPHQPPRRSSS
jgi:hypothetical protein